MRLPRLSSKLALGLAIVLAGAITAAVAISSSERFESGPGSVPADSRNYALSEVEHEYGAVSKVYAEAATTLRDWAELEPGNAAALSDSSSSNQDVYALFLEGQFVVTGPISQDGKSVTRTLAAGRIVFNANGELLSVQLWEGPKDASPPFGKEFDDR